MAAIRSDQLFLLLSGIVFASGVAIRIRADSPHHERPPIGLERGEVVPQFEREVGPDTGLRQTLAVFFTAECPWCRASVPQWNTLAAHARRVGWPRVVAVSLSDSSSTSVMARQTGFAIPTRILRDPHTPDKRWKVTNVPYTVLIGPDGEVSGAWVGFIDTARATAIADTIWNLRPWSHPGWRAVLAHVLRVQPHR